MEKGFEPFSELPQVLRKKAETSSPREKPTEDGRNVSPERVREPVASGFENPDAGRNEPADYAVYHIELDGTLPQVGATSNQIAVFLEKLTDYRKALPAKYSPRYINEMKKVLESIPTTGISSETAQKIKDLVARHNSQFRNPRQGWWNADRSVDPRETTSSDDVLGDRYESLVEARQVTQINFPDIRETVNGSPLATKVLREYVALREKQDKLKKKINRPDAVSISVAGDITDIKTVAAKIDQYLELINKQERTKKGNEVPRSNQTKTPENPEQKAPAVEEFKALNEQVQQLTFKLQQLESYVTAYGSSEPTPQRPPTASASNPKPREPKPNGNSRSPDRQSKEPKPSQQPAPEKDLNELNPTKTTKANNDRSPETKPNQPNTADEVPKKHWPSNSFYYGTQTPNIEYGDGIRDLMGFRSGIENVFKKAEVPKDQKRAEAVEAVMGSSGGDKKENIPPGADWVEGIATSPTKPKLGLEGLVENRPDTLAEAGEAISTKLKLGNVSLSLPKYGDAPYGARSFREAIKLELEGAKKVPGEHERVLAAMVKILAYVPEGGITPEEEKKLQALAEEYNALPPLSQKEQTSDIPDGTFGSTHPTITSVSPNFSNNETRIRIYESSSMNNTPGSLEGAKTPPANLSERAKKQAEKRLERSRLGNFFKAVLMAIPLCVLVAEKNILNNYDFAGETVSASSYAPGSSGTPSETIPVLIIKPNPVGGEGASGSGVNSDGGALNAGYIPGSYTPPSYVNDPRGEFGNVEPNIPVSAAEDVPTTLPSVGTPFDDIPEYKVTDPATESAASYTTTSAEPPPAPGVEATLDRGTDDKEATTSFERVEKNEYTVQEGDRGLSYLLLAQYPKLFPAENDNKWLTIVEDWKKNTELLRVAGFSGTNIDLIKPGDKIRLDLFVKDFLEKRASPEQQATSV